MTVTTAWSGTFNGLAFGVGSQVQLVEIDGLQDMPNVLSGDINKPRQNGGFAGLDYLDERIFTATLQPFNPSVPFATVVAQIAAAFNSISDPSLALPFEFLLPGWASSRFVTCRPTKYGNPINSAFQYFVATIPVELTAADPLIYSSTLQSATTGLPSPTAGATFPMTFPVTFGSSSGGSLSCTNNGNYITAPVFTITGPCTNPIITFASSGAFIKLNLTLGSSDVVVIDMANRTVTLNGTASRYNAIFTGSTWFGIPPGTWSFSVGSSDSATVAATFTVAWRDAWGQM